MKTTALLTAFATIALAALTADAATISGELRRWHKVTLDFTGPSTSESATPNPFTNYRLNVTFRHTASGKTYLVPGYYAADGNAADSGASSGNVWRVHFAPDETGTWTYDVSFRSGANVAMDANSTAGSSAGFVDGESGSLTISETDKTGRDLRGKGRLDYVGKHHLRFAGSGAYFMKAGCDAPENLLAYADFDGDFKTDGHKDELVKDWQPHVQDWNSGDPSWQNGKGKGLIGAINYLSDAGLNSFSFLTMNINGDDQNVFPYTTYAERLRMDVSKLDQWEIVFEHGDEKGMYLHFKTQETENELLLDGGDVGPQRKLYYRELIARFGHHLAMNWNMGEEINAASLQQKVAWTQFFYDNDPYHHHIVIHNGATHYNMMGNASKLTGFSLQLNASDFSDCFSMTKDYIDRADAAGKPWVVGTDEPGDSRYALRPDSDPGSSHEDARRDALWGNIMAGGAGVEWYFGYALENSDLTCNDFRSRDSFWPVCRNAINFFENNAVPFQDMTNANSLVSGGADNGNRCLAKPGISYLVQLRSGGSQTLDLSGQSGSYLVRWFDPRNGGALVSGNTLAGGGTRSLGSPPNPTGEDWIAWVQNTSGGTPTNQAPVVSAGSDRSTTLSSTSVSITLNGSTTDDGLPAGSTLSSTWSRVSGPANVSFANPNSASTNVTFTAAGSYVLRLSAADGSLSTADDVAVEVTQGQAQNQAPVVNAGSDSSAVLSGTTVQISLSGSASDDGLPTGSSLSASWTLEQGPAAVSFGNPSSATTTATFSTTGTYVLRLTATDGSLSSSDTVAVVITAPGAAATFPATQDAFTQDGSNVNNGDLRVESSSRERITYLQFDLSGATGSITNASLRLIQKGDIPSGPMTLRLFAASSNNWQEATITGASAPAKGAELDSFTGSIPAGMAVDFDVSSLVKAPGVYSFILDTDTAKDVTFASAENTTTSARPLLSISSSGGTPNAAPVISAGPDKSGSYQGTPVAIPVSGSASDDGLPAGSTLALNWSMTSGPAAVSFAPANAVSTSVTFSAAGTYVLRLSASDGALSVSDEVTVTVISDIIDNEIPTVSAGADASATLSAATVQVSLNGSASDDGQPQGSTLSTTWSRTSGPASVSFSNANSAATTATFSAAGTYVLRLTASDGELSDYDEMSVVISPASAASTTVTLAASQDAYTENGNNFNGSVLRLENSTRKRTIYLQFNASTIGRPSSAKLRLVEGDDVSTGSMTLRVFAAASNNWTEGNITGSNAPAKGAELASFTGDITQDKVLNFDVSSFVSAPGIYSFIVEADSSAKDVSFVSAEGSPTSARPALVVTTAAGNSAPPSVPLDKGVPMALQLTHDDEQVATLGLGGAAPFTRYAVERSIDLKTWEVIDALDTDESGQAVFQDTTAPIGQAFYRLNDQVPEPVEP